MKEVEYWKLKSATMMERNSFLVIVAKSHAAGMTLEGKIRCSSYCYNISIL
jgi:hypothetical protein